MPGPVVRLQSFRCICRDVLGNRLNCWSESTRGTLEFDFIDYEPGLLVQAPLGLGLKRRHLLHDVEGKLIEENVSNVVNVQSVLSLRATVSLSSLLETTTMTTETTLCLYLLLGHLAMPLFEGDWK